MPPAPEGQLRQLGAMVIHRRLEQGLRTKIQLAEKTGLSTRVLTDLEAGKRRLGTVSYVQIESALGWPAGTIDGFLDGYGSILDDEPVTKGSEQNVGADSEAEFAFLTRVREDLTDEEMDQLMSEATPYLQMLMRDIKARRG